MKMSMRIGRVYNILGSASRPDDRVAVDSEWSFSRDIYT